MSSVTRPRERTIALSFAPLAYFAFTSFALACSSSGVTVAVDGAVDDTGFDAGHTDGSDGSDVEEDSGTFDTAVADTRTDAPDTTVVDSGPADTTPFDAGPPDTAGTFVCGTERCGSTFQFCQIDTAPGTGRHCVALPSACFAFPACPCVVTVACSGALKGTCTDVAGAITLQCTP